MNTQRVVLIPAYEPDDGLIRLVQEMRSCGMEVILVDDGSSEDAQEVFRRASDQAMILRHTKNKGKGASLRTGLDWILHHFGGEYTVVTMDADGQHLPKDAVRVLSQAESEPGTLVLGSRRFQGKVPFKSRFGNSLTRTVFRLSTGVSLQDTQTGLRAFSSDLIPILLSVRGDRYEYEMNVLTAFAKTGRRIREVPIETVYLNDNRSSHFHVIRDSFLIYKELLKFSAASFASFLLDYGLYALFMLFSHSLVLSNLLARLISASFNYTINRTIVFEDRGDIGRSLLSYFLLSVGILAAGTLGLKLLVSVLSVHYLLAKIAVEMILFFTSYFVQKRWIFPGKEALS
ncbi:MAG: bifunctional glycosyltransferase family 2/GtrA family protein [Firmicutes bacterium]|nr:bifunctional glycosyltransferase family 2/GtrA family protein [Bacillota bacterium]